LTWARLAHVHEIWRSKDVQSPVEELHAPVVSCLVYRGRSEWHLGEIALAKQPERKISIAKKLNDTNALALALDWGAVLAFFERNPAEVDEV
jgi:hypothetical protein